ncbi:MAG: hypothetical protein HC859_00785 [Bacteroidia bacterium]|nr:hypothetical protein [Bacteroidia bacterium]
MNRRLLLVPLLCVTTVFAFSQGCSDAGFCTMGAMKPDQPFNKKIDFRLRSMEISLYRATTTTTAKILVATADLGFSFTQRTSIQVKIPYLAASGNLGSTSGLSDISLCLTRNVWSTDKFDINFSVGGKIPTNKSNIQTDGRSFPMYYQTSLGTYDLILGGSFINRNWLFAVGVQHPFNKNENGFQWKDWYPPIYKDSAYIEEHSQALELKRGTDVMIRVERNFRFSRFNFTVGMLPIYRVANDEITDPETGERIKPEGAKGLDTFCDRYGGLQLQRALQRATAGRK